MEDARSKSAAIRQLARELLDDIELGRLTVEQTVLKALRLARLSDAMEQQAWLALELVGYTVDDELSMKYMGWTGRWIDQAKRLAHRDPLAQLESRLKSWELQLQTIRIPDVNASISLSSSNPNEYVGGVGLNRRHFPDPNKSINAVIYQSNQLTENIGQISGIRTKTIAMIYNFVLNVYLQREFSFLTESIFDQYKLQVDSLIASTAGDALRKFPSVWMRLAEGDPEAISHALSTCRRIIDAFAESVYPEATIPQADFDANKDLKLGYTTRHRINAWVERRSPSDTQRQKLRQSLANIYGRVTAGVHNTVTPAEARALFLGTYLLLGEVLTLPEPPTPSADESTRPTSEASTPPIAEVSTPPTASQSSDQRGSLA